MCRIAVYTGPLLNVSTLVYETPHSLTDQSRTAKLMADSNVAGDGWGVGWFTPEAGAEPGIIKGVLPLWSDENARTATRAILSGSIVVHIRLASPGVETCFLNTPLYALDDRLWTVNGGAEPWPGPISKALRDRLDLDHEGALRGSTDAEMLGALWRTHFRREGSHDAAAAVRSMLRDARDVVRELGGKLKMNLILADAVSALAVRYADTAESNSLFYCSGEDRWNGGSLVASEPLDTGPGWIEAPADSLLHLNGEGLHVEPLDLDAAHEPVSSSGFSKAVSA